MKKHPVRLIAALSVSALFSLHASATLVWNETFTTNISANTEASYLGWNSYMGANGADMSDTAPGFSSSNRIGFSDVVGADNATRSYLFAHNGQTGTASLAFAATYTFDSPLTGVSSINWIMANSQSSSNVHVLIQQGGDWYASATPYSTANLTLANLQTGLGENKTLTFSTDASAWLDFDLTVGTSMGLGTPVGSDLSSSDITAIGFFIQNNVQGANSRIDNLSITYAVPEPSAFALVIGTGMLGLVILRRRNRHS